jgi:hypothetical protein
MHLPACWFGAAKKRVKNEGAPAVSIFPVQCVCPALQKIFYFSSLLNYSVCCQLLLLTTMLNISWSSVYTLLKEQ